MLPAQKGNVGDASTLLPGTKDQQARGACQKKHNVKNCFLQNMLVVVVVVVVVMVLLLLRVVVVVVVVGLGHTFALALCNQPFKRICF